jgi:hypothetical protein
MNMVHSISMMRTLIFITCFITSCFDAQAQGELFNSESDVVIYLEGKEFYNAENGLSISFGYLSIANTYAITVTNNNGGRFNFINVRIDVFGSFADLYGMSPEDGSNFGFRLYNGKLIIGRGEPGEQVFYQK